MQRPQHTHRPKRSALLQSNWAVHTAALALCACVMSGCEAPAGGWEVEFLCEKDAELAESLVLRVRAGGCEGQDIDTQELTRGQSAMPTPQLPPGSYGFEAVAMAGGEELAAHCLPVELPTHQTAKLKLKSEHCQNDGGWREADALGAGGDTDAATTPGAASDAAAVPGAEEDAQTPSDAGPGDLVSADAGADADADVVETAGPADAAEAGCATSCDDGNPCTLDACVEGNCVFEELSLTTECDAVPCTVNDQCVRGACVPGDPDDSMCADANECTSDTCIPSRGCSTGPLEDAPCDDGLDCTDNDRCKAGRCAGTPVCNDGEECAFVPGTCSPCEADEQCDDGDPCTLDTCACDGDDCQKTFCRYAEAPDGTECDDAADCSTNDMCQQGECRGEVAPSACDDANPCTDERCIPGIGCAFSLHEGSCDDGLGCTSGDVCVGGLCKGSDTCDDGNPCTMESCKATGCVPMPLDIECDDGLTCTQQDRCVDGQCRGTNACDDGEACTDERCVESGEVDTCEKSSRSGSCDDGRACTEGDYCEAGACVSGASTCGANASCGASQCSCESGFTPCGGQCVDLDEDSAHCGQCDRACASGVRCVQGGCVPPGCSQLSYGGHAYFGCTEALSWSQARQRCQGWGVDLALVTGAAEHDALAGWLPQGNHWLGGSDLSAEGVWRWVTPGASRDGTHFYEECDGGFLNRSCDGIRSGDDKYPNVYDNWGGDAPGASLSEDCLELQVSAGGSGVWNDSTCATLHAFVCEGL